MNNVQMRIFHGPVNIGGVGRYLADWQRQQGALADFIVFTEHAHARQKSHLALHINAYGFIPKVVITLSHFLLCLAKYDIFHFDFGNSLLPGNLDLPLLKLFRKKMLMTYYGSDIRLMAVERRRNPYAAYLAFGSNQPARDKWKKLKMRWQGLWIDRFFAVREEYDWAITCIPPARVIADIWITNPFDLAAYTPEFQTHPVPVLIHAPTNPGVKGTQYVEQAVAELAQEGYQFRYRQLENVPSTEAQRIYREEADIIVDQFYVGSFGNFALEGMYYGKPVCGYLMDDLQARIPDCPIVNCTIETLKDKLAWLIVHPEERIRLGKAGRAFVEKHCDAERINREVWAIYQELLRHKKSEGCKI